MFNVGGAELFVILLLALVVLGPDKLPGAMRTVGQWAGEMRKMANGFQAEMNKAIADPLDAKGAEASTKAKAGDVAPDADAPSSRATNGSSNGAGSNGSGAGRPAGTAADEGSGDRPEASA
jgi:sec-independent protein translocase protein TatB